PGIDLVYYGQQGQLEFDFVVRPGADPDVIRLHFEGAEQMDVDGDGGLNINLQGKLVRWHKPFIYQRVDGAKKEIKGNYMLENAQEVAFRLDAYDREAPLVIDPVLVYSSFLGGGDFDAA